MARKHKGRKMPIYRRVVKMTASIGSSLLIGSPVILPAVNALSAGLASRQTPQQVFGNFIFDASGYNVGANAFDYDKLQNVAVRDAALVGIGMFLRWASKRV